MAKPRNIPDDGTPVDCVDLRDKTVQFGGDFTSTNQLQGSINGVDYENLGSPVSSAAIVTVPETVVFIKNDQTMAGTGTLIITLHGHEER